MQRKPDPERAWLLHDWTLCFGIAPPPYMSTHFMRKALAYQAQYQREGGLPASTRRLLRRIAEGRALTPQPKQVARAGAHLVREWNGRTYQVEVQTEGYRMDKRIYPSLSAIAKQITGTTWSGPRFFGVTSRTAGRS